jgi:hypothetical protein
MLSARRLAVATTAVGLLAVAAPVAGASADSTPTNPFATQMAAAQDAFTTNANAAQDALTTQTNAAQDAFTANVSSAQDAFTTGTTDAQNGLTADTAALQDYLTSQTNAALAAQPTLPVPDPHGPPVFPPQIGLP